MVCLYLRRHLRIRHHQPCYAITLCLDGSTDAISLHDRLVVLVVGLAKFQGHGDFIIELSQRTVGIACASIRNGWDGLLNAGFLRVGKCGS